VAGPHPLDEPSEALRAQGRRRSSSDVDGSRGSPRGRQGVDLAAEGVQVAVGQAVVVADGGEVAVGALAEAEGDVDVDTEARLRAHG